MIRRRRLAVALSALAACGRVGFDPPTEHADARGGDSGPMVPADCVGPDEDGDGWPDVCDSCPTEPNPDQADVGEVAAGEGADGVGDACDPRPATSGDRVLFFESHAAAGAYNFGGAWSLTGTGALRLGAVADVGAAFFDLPLTTTRADASFEVIAVGAGGSTWFGIWLDVESTSGNAVFANGRDITGDALPGDVVIKEQTPSGDSYSSSIALPGDIVPGMQYRFVVDTSRATNGPYRLASTDLSTGTTEVTTKTISIPPSPAGYLEVNRAVVDIAYLIVYAY